MMNYARWNFDLFLFLRKTYTRTEESNMYVACRDLPRVRIASNDGTDGRFGTAGNE